MEQSNLKMNGTYHAPKCDINEIKSRQTLCGGSGSITDWEKEKDDINC